MAHDSSSNAGSAQSAESWQTTVKAYERSFANEFDNFVAADTVATIYSTKNLCTHSFSGSVGALKPRVLSTNCRMTTNNTRFPRLLELKVHGNMESHFLELTAECVAAIAQHCNDYNMDRCLKQGEWPSFTAELHKKESSEVIVAYVFDSTLFQSTTNLPLTIFKQFEIDEESGSYSGRFLGDGESLPIHDIPDGYVEQLLKRASFFPVSNAPRGCSSRRNEVDQCSDNDSTDTAPSQTSTSPNDLIIDWLRETSLPSASITINNIAELYEEEDDIDARQQQCAVEQLTSLLGINVQAIESRLSKTLASRGSGSGKGS